MPAQIHPTAIIDPGAQIGADVVIGPYCVIGDKVVIGDGCWLQNQVTMCGPSTIGKNNQFFAFTSIGQRTPLKGHGACKLFCVVRVMSRLGWQQSSHERPPL